jgi:ubiquinone/menaquinone biosynthesis C-methylase UbiE
MLRCPVTRERLEQKGDRLLSESGAEYRVENGIPVLLPPEKVTLWVADASSRPSDGDAYRTDTLGINDTERNRLNDELKWHADSPFPVDPVISALIFATGGHMYANLKHQLPSVPIPDIRVPPSDGATLLDIGCNWGRWSIAAARKGYRVVGVDPSLGAVLAAQRLAKRFNLDADFVVADGRYLPFAEDSFDRAFSYSVLQHFSVEDATKTVSDTARVLRPDGSFTCQMASAFGLRSLWHLARRGFRASKGFEVRYYTPRALSELFLMSFQTVEREVDGYFGLGIQPSDAHMLSKNSRKILALSEAIRRLSKTVPFLHYAADSLYLNARLPR